MVTARVRRSTRTEPVEDSPNGYFGTGCQPWDKLAGVPGDTRSVFLSYASEDSAAAERIAEALRAAGIEVWLDQRSFAAGTSGTR